MRLWPLGILLLCGLIATALLTSCRPVQSSTEIRMALSQAPLNLDPRYATDAASARINRLLYRALVDFDAHAAPRPDLANWHQINPRHYRFTLIEPRPRFHHGKLLDAGDVAATYQSLLALNNSPHRAEFSNIEKITVLDDRQVDFYLAEDDAGFAAKLILGIMPADLLAQGRDFSHAPVGSGPLQFAGWNSALHLRRLVDGQAFRLEEVKDPTVRVLKLLRGEADLLQGDLSPEMVKYLEGQEKINILTSKGANFSYLGFNLQDSITSRIEVRRAIAHAIDRDAIIAHAMVDDTRPAGALLPPEHWAGNPALKDYRYDPQLARQLLVNAGIHLPLKLVYKTSTDAQRVRLATMIQAQLQQAGIELEIRSLDWGTFFDDIKQGQFQLYGLTWVGIKTPDIYRMAFHSAALPPKGANRGRLHDEGLDKLIDRQDWKAVTERVQAMLPYVPLWYEGQFVAMRQDLVDYTLYPDGNWDGLKTVRRIHRLN